MPAILRRCNRCYIDASRKWGHTNIWTVLPTYFHQTRNEMAQVTNVLEGFLASQDIVLGADKFVPLEDFKMALKVFAQTNNYRQQQRYTWEYFRGPFEKAGITKVRESRDYRGRKLTRDYLVGVDLATMQAENALG